MEFENVLLFVSDSLRWEMLPKEISEKGVTFKTVASSTYSPPSFTSLSTGLYPCQHGVHWFNDKLAPGIRTVYDIEGLDGTFYNEGRFTNDPLYRVYGVRKQRHVSELEPPFLSLERETTTHAPYTKNGFLDGETVKSYFEKHGNDWAKIRADYEDVIRESFEVLEKRLDVLEDRGLREDTLVVFTSDHGELFGEYGKILHTAPTCPELVYVPTVFMHPSLSTGDFSVDPKTGVIEHVDVVKTCLEAVGYGDTLPTEGSDLFAEDRPRDYGYNQVRFRRKNRTLYSTQSIWWKNSGFVVSDDSRVKRLAAVANFLLRSPGSNVMRSEISELVREMTRVERAFGNPPLTAESAREAIAKLTDEYSDAPAQERVELDKGTKQLLRDLGYR